jgi:hypothetical protein
MKAVSNPHSRAPVWPRTTMARISLVKLPCLRLASPGPGSSSTGTSGPPSPQPNRSFCLTASPLRATASRSLDSLSRSPKRSTTARPRNRTVTPAQGRSASVRVARLWTRSAGSPQSGQRTSGSSARTRIVGPPSPTRSASTRSDGGTNRATGATMGHLRRPGGRTEAIVAEPRAHRRPRHLKCGRPSMSWRGVTAPLHRPEPVDHPPASRAPE